MFTSRLGQFMRVSLNRSFKFSESVLIQKRSKEVKLAQKIKEALNPSYIKVDDITIGTNSCGQMYNITVESQIFIGKSKVQQHQLVTNCISEELKNIHGYNLKTKVPEKYENKKQVPKQTDAQKKKREQTDKIDE